MWIDAAGRSHNDGSYVQNGRGHGIGEGLDEVRYEPGLLRPYIDEKGHKCITLNVGYKLDKKGNKHAIQKKYRIKDLEKKGIDSPVFNAGQMMRKEAWIHIDQIVVKAMRNRLRAWEDLRASSSVGGFDAMSKLTYEYQAMSDPGEAQVDMDTLSEARTDSPLLKLRSTPLPITHSDFWFSRRQLAVAARTGTPLDMTMVEAAARRCAEKIEDTVIGIETGITYGTRSGDNATAHEGTSTVYGYTNFPYRVTYTTLTTPTGANPSAVMADILAMISQMQDNFFYGPYILYHSTPYSRYLNDDYFRSGSTSAVRSLRDRLMEIDGITSIRRLDRLTSGYQLILVQMGSEVAQAIDGMKMTTVMWESQGGMRVNFKVMAIQTPLLKAPYNTISGIMHGTTS